MIIPLWEKIRSTGADVAGVQNSLWNSGRIRLYCRDVVAVWTVKSDSFGELIVSR